MQFAVSAYLALPFIYIAYKGISVVWSFFGFRNWFVDQTCPSNERIDGKVVVITGGNGGIGAETAKELVMRGATVYIACRNVAAGEEVRMRLVALLPHLHDAEQRVQVMVLDLASLASVREFAAEFQRRSDRLDILINNAGVMMCPLSHTADGHELQMATNHLGHFLLTSLLKKLIVKSAPSRIVVVSSCCHWLGSSNFEDLAYHRSHYDPTLSYAQSKLANLLFAKELARRLRGTRVTVNALHPGVVDTPLFRHVWILSNPVSEFLLRPVRDFVMKTSFLGAATSVYLSVAKELDGVSGEYFSDCRPSYVSPNGKDAELAKVVWTKSEELVGIEG